MPVPSHGLGCRTVASYKTHCQYCGDSVRYFECTCGSKVFFEDVPSVFKRHECLERLMAFVPKDFLEKAMAEQMMRPGIKRPPAQLRERVIKESEKRRFSQDTLRWEPADGATLLIEGVLREIVEQPNLAKHCCLPKAVDLANPMTRAMLGRMSEPRVQTTVVVSRTGDSDDAPSMSCTCFVSVAEFGSASIGTGDTVLLKAVGEALPTGAVVWIGEEIGPLRD